MIFLCGECKIWHDYQIPSGRGFCKETSRDKDKTSICNCTKKDDLSGDLICWEPMKKDRETDLAIKRINIEIQYLKLCIEELESVTNRFLFLQKHYTSM